MISAPELCERLAALLRSGHSVRSALVDLPRHVGTPFDSVIRCARLASLGASFDRCLAVLAEDFGPELDALPPLLNTATASGSDTARSLDRCAGMLRRRERARRDAEVAAAGARMSARTIAALPLMMVPLAIRQASDPLVVVALGIGVALWLVGYRWLVRVIPVPEDGPRDAVIAEEVAAALQSGQSLDRALRSSLLAHGPPTAARRACLGAPWSRALDPEYAGLARSLGDAGRTGVPVAFALESFAQEEHRIADQRFQERVGKAPVRMVVPLVCCMLPSFVLVAIVPLLRGLSLAA